MPLSKEEIKDMTIIGAGPCGLFGGFYAGLRGMSFRIIDALEEPGGQLVALYPEKYIYDVPGFPKILAKDLAKNLVEQVNHFHPEWHLEEKAVTLRREKVGEEEIWVVGTNKGEYPSRTVLITAGIGAFSPKRLGNEEVERFEGKGVYYLVKNLQSFSGKKVLIVGGGDSAVDWALALSPIAEKVTLIHRRDKFRAHEGSVKALYQTPVEIKLFYELKTLHGDTTVREAVIYHNKTREEETIPVDGVILALGFQADLGEMRNWGFALKGKRYILVNSRMETTLPGVYAAGDIASSEDVDPLNLIVVGFGQVTVAVQYAYVYIHPKATLFPGHSSEMEGGPAPALT
jgi:thioredoxin reductase (NADPH)